MHSTATKRIGRKCVALAMLLGLASAAPGNAASETAAPAPQTDGVRELFKKFGLFGTWSIKCGEYYSTEWADGPQIQQILASGKERLAGAVEQAVEIAPDELLITTSWDVRLTTKLLIEGDRKQILELTANGSSLVEGGVRLEGNRQTDWEHRCQKLTPAPAGAGVAGSVRQIMEKYGAFGAWALNCSKPASNSNDYEVFRPMDDRFVQIDMMRDPAQRTMVSIVETASEAGPSEFMFTSMSKNRDVLRLKFEGNRVRELGHVRNGAKLVEDGRFMPEKTIETPWSDKCPQTPPG